MKTLIRALTVAFLALLPALAAAQTGPTLPSNTVWGRTGIGPGPAQAIPFATLSSLMWGTVPNNTVLGNVSGSTALMTSLTATQLTTLCNAFTSSLKGCVPASGGGTANFLRADGTFAPAFVAGGTQGQVLLKNSGTNGDATFRDQCLNIQAFGGVGDGTTANDTAFSNAWNALASNGGCIFFPTGKYKFTSAVSKTLPNAQFTIALIGAARDSTVLFWPNASGGLTLTGSNVKNSFHIRDLTFTTSQNGSGTGVKVAQGAYFGGNAPMSDFTNVSVRGDDLSGVAASSNYWSVGIHLHNWSNINVVGVDTWGPFNPTPGGAAGGTGLFLEGHAASTNYIVIVNIIGSAFNAQTNGIILGDYWQGVTIEQSNFNGALGTSAILQTGAAAGLLSLLNITNSQFNYAGTQISLNSPILNLMLIGNTITTFGNGGIGVSIPVSSVYANISGNFFNTFGSPTGTFGIATQGAAGNITGNVFTGVITGVNLQGSSSNYNVSQNTYTSSVTTKVTNTGAGNSVGAATQ